jgi:hypothetical protein
MQMLRNSSFEEHFDTVELEKVPVSLPVQRTAPPSWPLTTMLRTVVYALRDGVSAARRYEHLRSRGIAHDLALRMAIDVRRASSDIRPAARRHLSGPLARSPRKGEAVKLCREEVCPAQIAQSRGSARIANLAYAHGA